MSTITLSLTSTYDFTDDGHWKLHAECEGRHAELVASKNLLAVFPELAQMFTERLCRQVQPEPPVAGENVRGGEKAFAAKLLRLVHNGATAEDVYDAVRSYYMNGATE